ncbi:MAG: transposase [Candidatus Methanoperedenaceae archaeon]|nr:transposase [Candidatus Methanoperedenaceae archaeon]
MKWTAPKTKITLLRELDNGKSSAQVCRENGIHPLMLSKWKREYKENPVIAFSGNISKPEAKLAESGRLIGQLYAENADKQLTLILRYCGIERTIETVMNVYSSQALDPHVNRYRFREDWWS